MRYWTEMKKSRALGSNIFSCHFRQATGFAFLLTIYTYFVSSLNGEDFFPCMCRYRIAGLWSHGLIQNVLALSVTH